MNSEIVHTTKCVRATNDYLNYLWVTYPKLKLNSEFKKMKEETPENIPKFNEYDYLVKYNYKIMQLKQIAKKYK